MRRLIVWLACQAVVIWRQRQGGGRVSGFAHAGGIAMGVVWRVFLRRPRR